MASTIDDTGFKKQRYQELRKDIAGDWAADGLSDVTNNQQEHNDLHILTVTMS